MGEEGTLEVARGHFKVTPKSLEKLTFSAKDTRLYQSKHHQKDWIGAIQSRKDPIANVEVGHRTASVCNLVNITYELQKQLEWNPKKEIFSNSSYANQLLSRPYRGKWDYMNF
ncbi:hypothetical protein D3C79_963820 [compost metagenome]